MRAAILALVTVLAACRAEERATMDHVIDHVVKDIDGKDVSLASYRGKVLLIVNVASECGYTPQYTDLEALYERYAARGLVVLGFPSNDFGSQEPGSCEAIKDFATSTYGVTFPLFDKVHAKGDAIAPLYKTLTTETPFPGPVKWNFAKFVVDKRGHVVARFPSATTPFDAQLTSAIERALAEPG
jgi:glutathione peroxidase